MLRIVIADREALTRKDIRTLLVKKGYEIVGEAADGFDAVELCRRTKPNIILIDAKLPLLDGTLVAKIIREEELSDAIILLTAYTDEAIVENAKEHGVSVFLTKPIEPKLLLANVEIAAARGRERVSMRRNMAETEKKLEERKLIERAKAKLMEVNGLSDQEAYAYIRNMSKTKNVAMRRVAELVLWS